MESDLIFPVDVYPETAPGISVEWAIRTEPKFTGGLKIDKSLLAYSKAGSM